MRRKSLPLRVAQVTAIKLLLLAAIYLALFRSAPDPVSIDMRAVLLAPIIHQR